MRNTMKLIGDYNDWTLEDFNLEKPPLGKGGFGTVYRAECLRLGFGKKQVAIKQISKEKLVQDKKLRKYVEKEISIHKQLKHPNIVECYTTFEDRDYVYLVLELCIQTLSAYLKKGKVPEISAINIIEQVVKGMLYLHEKKILHRDISIGNILLTSDIQAKICDLGFGTLEDDALTSVLGTPHFISPEIKNGQPYDYKSDSYSLGVVIFAVLGGELPMNKDSIEMDQRFSREARDLMKALLVEDPAKRIGIDEVFYKNYEFFNKYRVDPSKAQNYSLKNKDSGVGSINSSSTSSKNQYRFSKYFDSGLDSFNSCLKELKKSPCFPNTLKRDPKTFCKTYKDSMPQNSKESSEQRYLPHYGTQTQHYRNNLPKRASPTFHSTHSNRKERSVSEERRRQEKSFNSLHTTRNRSNETRPRKCSPHEELDSFSYSQSVRSNTQTEKCMIDFCKFKHSIFEDNHSNPLTPVSLVSEKKISQEKFSLNRQENLALNSKHSSCSDQSRKNLPPKKPQHGSSGVEQKPQRLNAERLRPHRYPYKKIAVVSILENEDVCVEWLKTKKKKQYVSQVLHISDNKDVIYAYQPKHCLVGPKPPPKPGNLEEIQDFSFDALPSNYWKMYRIAKNIVDFARAGTPKITCFKENFKFVMMENYPDPDLDMEFFDGGRIKQISNKVSVIDKSGAVVEDMDDRFQAMYEKFIDMKAWCRKMEAQLETLNISFDYPIMFGDSTKYHSKKNICL